MDDAETAAVVADLLAPIEDHVAVTALGAVSVGHAHRARGLARSLEVKLMLAPGA